VAASQTIAEIITRAAPGQLCESSPPGNLWVEDLCDGGPGRTHSGT
jgi:hypothetical protein